MSYSRYVSPNDFRLMFEAVKLDNDFSARDVCLLVVFYSTGMTLSEVSRLKVGNVLDAQGKMVPHFDLSSKDAFNSNVRRIHWVLSWLSKVLPDYLAWRQKMFPGQFDAHGLMNPETPFFVDNVGEGYKEQNATEINQKVYKTSTALSLKIRELHKLGQLPNGNAESARRSFSVWLHLGHLTGSPVHLDWIRLARGDQRLSTTISAIKKDIPKGYKPLEVVFSKILGFHSFR